jgi:hypothetical protein
VGLTTSPPCGSLNLLHPSEPVQARTGTEISKCLKAFLYDRSLDRKCYRKIHSMGANLWRCDVYMLVESKLIRTNSTRSSSPPPPPARSTNTPKSGLCTRLYVLLNVHSFFAFYNLKEHYAHINIVTVLCTARTKPK